ncbi:hypothetical protein BHS09_08255 [Myxococcus xanthus]|uniref:Lipoprotein n=2 Tax=Myxococcus xanthus TaxID=34 RepID=A0AAE6FXY5_MYXXA|nr:hypothetical protein BHS09_08255 [Myxococcus xanthus]QDE74277.1 hypothetical protein BHS08_08260 [Myxococcus xanthus]
MKMNPRGYLALLAVMSLSSLACGDSDPEEAVTISQGVYGMTSYVNDVCSSGCERDPRSMTLLVKSLPQDTDVASVTSNEDGFYEVALALGDYRICTTFGRCTDFSVGNNEVVRLDYEMSVGPGWSR